MNINFEEQDLLSMRRLSSKQSECGVHLWSPYHYGVTPGKICLDAEAQPSRGQSPNRGQLGYAVERIQRMQSKRPGVGRGGGPEGCQGSGGKWNRAE